MRYTILFLLLTLGCASPNELAKSSVMITNLSANSGGSGTIIESTSRGSAVLTNAHVCEVIKNSGLVHTKDGNKHMVTAYKVSQLHDLCLILVTANLKNSSSLSYFPPSSLDESIVIGHPNLYPVIINKGHFSGKLIVPILTGTRACTEEDLKNPNSGLFCLLLGVVPIIKVYQSVLVSNLIMPGSSGSAVYGPDGGISAVIFAGEHDLSYGFAVPYEYVANFIRFESRTLPWVKADPILRGPASDQNVKKERVVDLCQDHVENRLCRLILQGLSFRDLIKR